MQGSSHSARVAVQYEFAKPLMCLLDHLPVVARKVGTISRIVSRIVFWHFSKLQSFEGVFLPCKNRGYVHLVLRYVPGTSL